MFFSLFSGSKNVALCEAAPTSSEATTEASQTTPPPSSSPAPTSTPFVGSPLAQIVSKTQNSVRKPLPNPGPFEQMKRESQGVLNLWEAFDGFQFSVSKPLNQQFGVNHSILMGTSMIPKQLGHSTYKFGANLCYDEGNIIIISSVDKMGRVEGRCMYKDLIGKGSMVKLITQLASEEGMTVCYGDVDYAGSDWSGHLKFGNMGGGMYMAQGNYMQSITKDTAVGADLQYLPSRNLAVSRFGARTQGTVDARVGKPGWAANVEYSTQGKFLTQYSRQVTKRLALASEFSLNLQDSASKVTGGWQYNLAQSAIKGTVNTQGKVAVTVKEMLNPALSVLLSAELDHKKGTCKVGYGLNIGQ